MTVNPVDYTDVQGLVRYGFGGMTECCFYLVKVRDAPAASSWLASAQVTTAEEKNPPPSRALQIAFTSEGLEAFGVPDQVIKEFSSEFVSGMTGDQNRSRRLGDTGANSPDGWRWGHGEKVPHLAVMIYAGDGLTAWEQTVKGQNWDVAFEVIARLPTSFLGPVEPFGFVDGISQPKIDWDRKRKPSGDQVVYSNLVSLGEFLLGYPNEYGEYSDRPLMERTERTSELLPAEDRADKKDLARNGTYLVMRQLEQDVRGFWQFLDKATGSDPQARQKLAEAMVGRTMNGKPLLEMCNPIDGVGPDKEDIGYNQFTYQGDDGGARCPVGSHIRRSNPRNADFPQPVNGFISRLIRILGFGRKDIRDDLMAPTRFHRILRRGREYGEDLFVPEALEPAPPNDPERGLHFVCLNSNIARQFEFVQSAWCMSTKFNGLTEESDPLIGNREPIPGCPHTDSFSVPQENGLRRRVNGLPQFVFVRGGAYFFLPSLRALRYFARLGSTSQT
jgi:deferrochelatase/peroxidase EfeB